MCSSANHVYQWDKGNNLIGNDKDSLIKNAFLATDNQTLLNALKLRFLSLPYRLTIVTDGRDLINNELANPDIILIDSNLSNINSVDLCRELRSDMNYGQVPIIMVADKNEEGNCIKALDAGADDFISMYFEPFELQTRINRITNFKRSNIDPVDPDELMKLIEFSNDNILVLNDKMDILLANSAIINLLSIENKYELIGKNFISFIANDDKVSFSAHYNKALTNTATISPMESTVNIMNGKMHTFKMDIRHLNLKGKPVSLIYLKDSISEDASDTGIKRLATLVDNSHDAIYYCDLEGRITFWNLSAEKIYGWQGTDIIGSFAGALFDDANASLFVDALRDTLVKGWWEGEVSQVSKSGNEIIVYSQWNLLRDSKHKPVSITVINTDITEKKSVEQKIIHNDRIETIGEMTCGIIHDLNNFITPISASVQYLRSINSDEYLEDIYRTIETGANQLHEMLDQLRMFYYDIDIEKTLFNINTTIGEFNNIAEKMFPTDIHIHTAVPDDTWYVYGEPTQMLQVLMNLGINARDSMPEGGNLTISVDNYVPGGQHKNKQDKSYILIKISDTGTGIKPEDKKRIFNPYFTTKQIDKGSGLGLSIVDKIVQNHGGFIDFESVPGKGTDFYIYLPAQQNMVEDHENESNITYCEL